MLKTIILLIFSVSIAVILLITNIIPIYSISAEDFSSLSVVLIILICLIFGTFLVSQISGNYSQVDKLWNIMPIVYTWIYAYQSGFQLRLIIMAILVSIWGLRLCYNFWRKGGLPKNPLKFWEGEEDYRWHILQKLPMFQKKKVTADEEQKFELNKFSWTLFNLSFISAYQLILIFLFSFPAFMVLVESGNNPSSVNINMFDVIIMCAMLGLIIIETIADQQQYNFQTEKYRRINAGEELGEYKQGFCNTGLWRISRHPNFLCEQLIWICFYLFSVSSTGKIVNISMIGFILLLLLFRGSANFSEGISAKKYPEYKNYQKQVPCFLPNPFFGRKK